MSVISASSFFKTAAGLFFGIEYLTKTDMSLNKQIKRN